MKLLQSKMVYIFSPIVGIIGTVVVGLAFLIVLLAYVAINMAYNTLPELGQIFLLITCAGAGAIFIQRNF